MNGMFGFSQATINSMGLSLFATGMAFSAAWFWRSRAGIKEKADALALAHALVVARVYELETKVRLAEQATTPIITAFQAILVKQLTHLDKVEMDRLLVKVGPPDTLTDAEHERLHEMLVERAHDMSPDISDTERAVARIMPTVMKMATEEQKNFATSPAGGALSLVTIVSVVATDGTSPQAKADQVETKDTKDTPS